MFLPVTKSEMNGLGWDQLDIILVTGDAYIDSPYMGISLIGKLLLAEGFRVGVIAQPDVNSDVDILRLGEPRLFWGVSGGAVDSMVANYTATGKKRKKDDYTPGGFNTKRPDRAVIAYCNLIRRFRKGRAALVLGGIEASLRRIAHYDQKSDSIRRSILFDARGDYLSFGMAEKSVIELANALQNGHSPYEIRGIGYISKEAKGLEIPDYETVKNNKTAYLQSFQTFYENMDPITANGICQRHGDRWLVLNPPQKLTDTASLDRLHELDYERSVHPYHAKDGVVRALDTLRFSIPTHYGCYGECNFCAIAVHQGRTVVSRSVNSIVREAEHLTKLPGFKGYIHDLGGPTANMYGFECPKKLKVGACKDKRCLFPKICPTLRPNHGPQLELLQKIERIPGVKKVFVTSGIRHDLILADKENGDRYLRKICENHVSGQLKLAPEHSHAGVLKLMGKETSEELLEFKKRFDLLSKKTKKKQFLTYYFIAAHPGCRLEEMKALRTFCKEKLGVIPEQVQIFTPTPSTWSTLMYYTECDPFNNEKIFVERKIPAKEKQKELLVRKEVKIPKTETLERPKKLGRTGKRKFRKR